MSSRKPSHLLLSLCFFLTFIAGQNNCPISYQCSYVENEPQISYPFRVIDRQGEGCGYPGFDLTCNTFDKPVLKLPHSGDFLVRKVDYVNKEIRLYDQGNCLARRFQQQNLDIHLSPFKAFGYQTLNFYNCPPSATNNPPNELAGKFLGVPCLSDQRNTVLYTISSGSPSDGKISQVFMSLGCLINAPITIPVPLAAVTNAYAYELIHGDLYLTWVDPDPNGAVNEPKNPLGGDKPDSDDAAYNFMKLLKAIGPIIGVIGAIGTIITIYKCCCSTPTPVAITVEFV
ncbi:hypothetical protein C5167_033910 [Papaver somniferum]|uniref:RING-type E3 ubiquitin transferase n=1 Tax=Papaver somniferum TaxID=3469 RepID=A0A4Y7KD56_PAPSO|nr:hypothetical protein C5167_033910 [Papaver somniferum]